MFCTGMCPSHSGQMNAGPFGDAERSNKSELKNATARTSIFFLLKKTLLMETLQIKLKHSGILTGPAILTGPDCQGGKEIQVGILMTVEKQRDQIHTFLSFKG